eukprot:SAG11_NODE_6383_length_1324_cov_1.751020_2_plen_183_part_00
MSLSWWRTPDHDAYSECVTTSVEQPYTLYSSPLLRPLPRTTGRRQHRNGIVSSCWNPRRWLAGGKLPPALAPASLRDAGVARRRLGAAVPRSQLRISVRKPRKYASHLNASIRICRILGSVDDGTTRRSLCRFVVSVLVGLPFSMTSVTSQSALTWVWGEEVAPFMQLANAAYGVGARTIQD